MQFPSEDGRILDVQNIIEKNFSINYLFNTFNMIKRERDSNCRIIELSLGVQKRSFWTRKFGLAVMCRSIIMGIV